jgi:DNA repair photolyase
MSGRLFGTSVPPASLPRNHLPARPPNFDVERIILAKGSVATPERRDFVDRICAVYPEAEIVSKTSISHNRIDLGNSSPLELHREGKHTLLFGELSSAVRFSEEDGNSCPNYWHFSPYGFCPYGCKYCYLAGTRGVWYSPSVKIYVNLPEIVSRMDRVANRLARPTAFYLGKLQDGLALDPLTAYSTVLVPFFAQHPYARQVLLTKSASVDRLLDLDHGRHTILSWSLNPPEVSDAFEENVPSVAERLGAMRRCADRGYPVRAVIMPIVPIPGWHQAYENFITELPRTVPIQRLTFGGICIYKGARRLMEEKIGRENAISRYIFEERTEGDGRARYAPALRLKMYDQMIACARRVKPDLELALCLEDVGIWNKLGLQKRLGRCNCVL